MGRRTATVLNAFRASIPNLDGVTAIKVLTDNPRRDESAFFMELTEPYPQPGDTVEWGTKRVWWKGGVYRKRGYSFDDSAPRH